MIHHVARSQGLTFGHICETYVKFISQKYGKAIVVFYGYENGPSINQILNGQVESSGCKTYHAAGDGAAVVIKTVVEDATNIDTVSIGDGTDLLVLLCYYAQW